MQQPSAFVQLWTWMFFLGVFVIAWNLATITALKRFDKQMDINDKVRRPFVLVVGMYAFAVATLNIALLSMLAYCICTVMCMTSTYAPEWWERIMRVIAQPSTVFNCLSIDHMLVHGMYFAIALVTMSIMTWWYITDEDMRDPERVRHKLIRIIMIVPGSIILVAYLFYGCYSVLTAYTLKKRIDIASGASSSSSSESRRPLRAPAPAQAQAQAQTAPAQASTSTSTAPAAAAAAAPPAPAAAAPAASKGAAAPSAAPAAPKGAAAPSASPSPAPAAPSAAPSASS